MEYERFRSIINQTVFANDSKEELLVKIADSPQIFVGLFRPTTPEVKMAQYVSQSHEIKFGYAMEQFMNLYLEENGCEMFDSSIVIKGLTKNLDIFFRKGKVTYMVEQKTRDNHDSTKKRGQISDFKTKLETVSKQKKGELHGVLFFLDPGMKDNRKFYKQELAEITETLGIDTSLVYGGEFFELLSLGHVWDELVEHLRQWRQELPSFPEFNYDSEAEETFEEIKNIRASILYKLFSNKEVGDYILPILFPECKTLEMLADYRNDLYRKQSISQLIKERIKTIKGNA